jgi:PAS domain S-box-containing protein
MLDIKSRLGRTWLRNRLSSSALSYGGAIALVGLAALVSTLLYPLIEPNPFLLFFAAIAVSAWYGGLGPGLLAILLGLIVSSFIFMRPLASGLFDAAVLVRLSGFVLVGALITLLSESRRKIAISAHNQREQLAVTLSSIGDAVIATDKAGLITFLNPVAEALTGWPAGEAVGQPIGSVFRIINADTRQPVANPIMRVLQDGLVVGLANHTLLITRDGKELPIDDSGAPIRSSASELIGAVLVFRDISAQYKASEQAAFLANASQIFSSSLDYQMTLQRVADLALSGVADWCVIDVVGDNGAIELVAVAHIDPAKVRWAVELRERYPMDPQAPYGAPNVIRLGQPELYSEISDAMLEAVAHNPEELAILRAVGYRSVMILPLRARDQTFGAISFVLAERERYYSSADLTFAQAIADRAALAIDNGRLYQAAQAEIKARRQSELSQLLLAKAGTVLTAGLDYEATLQQVVRIALPEFADYTIIHMIDRADQLERSAVAHSDPAQQSLLEELQEKYPIDPKQANPLREALHGSGARLISGITDETLIQYRVDDEHLRLMRAIGTRSYIIVPMWGRGQRLGTLLFAITSPARSYTPADLPLAEELAYRIALALDNAQLYAAERKARMQAEAAVQLRDNFLSAASHELRTPLTSLLMQSQLLERRLNRNGQLPERDQRMLQVIGEQVHRLDRMINTMLDISRLEGGQLMLSYEPFDLAALAQRVIAEVQPTSESHPISYQPPQEPCLLYGDELRMEQVLQNLLQNAIKYSPGGGPVRVCLFASGDLIELAVSDQGIGIPQDALPRIFTRFYRASNVSPKRISGLGIGLALIKEIVMLHSGKVTVESEEGVGSTFHVFLPRYLPPA